MTTQPEDDFGDDNFDDGGKAIKALRDENRALKKSLEEAKPLMEELTGLKRERTFAEAGIDVKDPKAAYFVKGYDGEVTVEAIKAAGTEAGFIAPPAPDPQQQQQLTDASRIVSAGQGASPAAGGSEDAVEADLRTAMANGGKNAMLEAARQHGGVVLEDMQ